MNREMKRPAGGEPASRGAHKEAQREVNRTAAAAPRQGADSTAAVHDAHVTAEREWRRGQARRFLLRLDPAADVFTFQTFDDTPAKRGALARVMHGEFDRLEDSLDGLQQQRAGVFVTIAATDGGGRRTHNVKRVRALFVDLDGAPLGPVLAAGLDPQIVVESSPGRFHAYWLTDDCPLDQFGRVQRALARKFGGDPSVHDLPRVMRLPGFRHFKAKAQTSRLLVEHSHDGPPYALAEIVGTLGLELDAANGAARPVQDAPLDVSPETLINLRSALACIPSDDRDVWVAVAHALHALGDDGRKLWDVWSQRSDKYDPDDADRVWNSIRTADRTGFRAVFARAQKIGWINPAGAAPLPAAADEFDAPAGLHSRLVSLANIDASAPAPHFVERILPADEVTLLGGHGGLGKSYIALLLGLHLATGRPFGPLAVQQSRVLFYSAEDGAATLRHRVARLCAALTIDPARLDGSLDLLDLSDGDPALHRETVCYHEGERRVTFTTNTLDDLAELVHERAPGVVIVDGASDTFDDDEVSRARVRTFVRSLRQQIARPGRAVLLLAHVNKTTAKAAGQGDNESYSGSTAWHNSVRSRLALIGEAGGVLTLQHQKANHAAKAEPIPIEFRDGVPGLAGRGPNPAAEFLAEQQRRQDRRDMEALLDLVRRFEQRGERVTTSAQGPANVYRLLRGERGFPANTGPDRLMRLLRELETAGRLFRVIARTADRKPREVFRTLPGDPESAPIPDTDGADSTAPRPAGAA